MKEELQKSGDGKLCVIIILVKDGKILSGFRNYTKEVYKDISVWTLPGGRSEIGENLEQTLRRETAEEVGIKNFEIIDHIGIVPGVKEGDTITIFFGKTDEEAELLEPEKFSEWRWIPISEYVTNEEYGLLNPPGYRMIANYLVNLQNKA